MIYCCFKRSRYVYKNAIGKNNRGIITVRSKQRIDGIKVGRYYNNYTYLDTKLNHRFLSFINVIKARVICKREDMINKVILYSIKFLTGPMVNCYSYCSVSKKLYVGNIILLGNHSFLYEGNIMPIYCVRTGSLVHNIAGMNSAKSTYVKKSKKSAFLLFCGRKYSVIKLPSGQTKLINKCNYCVYGELDIMYKVSINKAGESRKRGCRPKVRGVAMNACDHPHGGGEGKQSIGRKHIYSLWGKRCKGIKTVNRKHSK